jgi:hypothetical protein
MTITLDASDLPATRTSLGANDAANLTTGTLADARFPATLPAASGANLTALTSANLTGALPAISGAALTSLNATNLGSGTVPDARFPATLPAASGVNLTALNASNISSGTVPVARLGSGSPGSGNFLRGDGSWQAVGGSAGYELLSTVTASSASAATFGTSLFTASHRSYVLDMNGCTNGTDNAEVRLEFGIGSTPTFGSTAQMAATVDVVMNSGSHSAAGLNGLNFVKLLLSSDSSGDGGWGGRFVVLDPLTADKSHYHWHMHYTGSGGFSDRRSRTGVGFSDTTNALTALRIVTNSGTFSGNFRLYGIAA